MVEQAQTVGDLRERIVRARAEVETLLGGVSNERLEERTGDGWSIGDHLVHLAAWERGVAHYLQGRSRGGGMGLGEEAWKADMDEVNAAIQERHAGLTAVEARRLLAQAQAEMDAALDGLRDEDLARDYGDLLPPGQESPYGQGTVYVYDTIAGNTFGHYEEHMETLRTMLAAR